MFECFELPLTASFLRFLQGARVLPTGSDKSRGSSSKRYFGIIETVCAFLLQVYYVDLHQHALYSLFFAPQSGKEYFLFPSSVAEYESWLEIVLCAAFPHSWPGR